MTWEKTGISTFLQPYQSASSSY